MRPPCARPPRARCRSRRRRRSRRGRRRRARILSRQRGLPRRRRARAARGRCARAASARAVATPMPRAAPVMIAVRSPPRSSAQQILTENRLAAGQAVRNPVFKTALAPPLRAIRDLSAQIGRLASNASGAVFRPRSDITLDYVTNLEYKVDILAHRGASSGDDPAGGAGSGVLRLRLVTANSGGPGRRPTALRISTFWPASDATPDTDPPLSLNI